MDKFGHSVPKDATISGFLPFLLGIRWGIFRMISPKSKDDEWGFSRTWSTTLLQLRPRVEERLVLAIFGILVSVGCDISGLC